MHEASLSQDKEHGSRNIGYGMAFLRRLLVYFEFSTRRICNWDLISVRWLVFLWCVRVSVLDQTHPKSSLMKYRFDYHWVKKSKRLAPRNQIVNACGRLWPRLDPNLFFFFFLFWCGPGVWKSSGQGWNPSWSCNLCHSCSNAGSLTHCTRAGTPEQI